MLPTLRRCFKIKYYGKIQDQKDLITKEYADAKVATTSSILKGDGAGNAVAAEVKEAEVVSIDSTPTANSSNLVTSGGVYSAVSEKQIKITASGILKGNGNGSVSAAVEGTDYQAPIAFTDDPDGNIIKIDGEFLAARYDYAANEITTTYAAKTELNGKENKGKITISGVEKTANAHAVTIVTNGVTTTMTLVGVS